MEWYNLNKREKMIKCRSLQRILVCEILIITLCVCSGHKEEFSIPEENLIKYVDPIIGTKGAGNVIPGPMLPHGMVKLSPDTNVESQSIDAYEYSSDRIEGFSHTHLEGPGGSANGYSQVLLMPTTGEIEITEEKYASQFNHGSEIVCPGYYAVALSDYNVRAELTATEHCGFHRYTFLESADANILIDVGHSKGQCVDGIVEVIGDNVIQGYGIYNIHPLIAFSSLSMPGTTAISPVFFYAEFSKPFDSYGTWSNSTVNLGSDSVSGDDIGAFVSYTTSENEIIEVKVGISSIDIEQARLNFTKEISKKGFDEVREGSGGIWNKLLNRIHVEGGTEDQKKIFYTALYHSLIQPTDYTEYGRFWCGYDGEGSVFSNQGFRFYSDDWCLWDTFRTTHPLQIILEPERRSDIIRSYVHMYEQGGWIPKCTWHATGYSMVMIGNHAFSVIADAYLKGFQDFDVDKAYEGMKKGATQDNTNILSESACGYLNLGTPPDYINLGYVPEECDHDQAVSMTLEYAYNDWCMALMAKSLGNEDDYDYFNKRSNNYVNHFNPEHGFMQQRDREGEWVEPFDPKSGAGFCEADSWIYTWFVPHDVRGLIDLMGGRGKFEAKLDAFFEGGHYDESNEPNFHVPYLYNYVGAPWKTQAKVRELMDAFFTSEPSGLPGNDDAGATSAWYVFSAMGLYPVSPGDGVYIIGSLIFDKITISLNTSYYKGEQFVIEARSNSSENKYIQSATLNGEPLPRPWIRHSEIVNGGTLIFEMGNTPSDWGSEPENAPPSNSVLQ